jgi:hypothetical protein
VSTRLLTLILVVVTAMPLAAQSATADPNVWSTFADSLSPGAFIVVKTRAGRSMRGTFVQRRPDGILVQEKTRIPVPPREVRFAEITAIERSKAGWSPGLKIVVGVGIGVAVTFLTTALVLAAVGYD